MIRRYSELRAHAYGVSQAVMSLPTSQMRRIQITIPRHAVAALPLERLLTSAEISDDETHLELTCSVEAATALVERLCALRHTSARRDTRLLWLCADVVAAVQGALDRELDNALGIAAQIGEADADAPVDASGALLPAIRGRSRWRDRPERLMH